MFSGFRFLSGFIAIALSTAFAADVGPMYFLGIDDTLQQSYWDKLMTFKAWGTTGFSMYRGTMPDTSGAIGTASGDIDLQADGITLGGKILVGGDLKFEAGTGKLIKGPVRTTGDFTSGTNGSLSYQGTYCIEGEADAGAMKGILNAKGTLLEGAAATSGDCGYDVVSEVPTTLKVPLIDDSKATYQSAISVSGSGNVYYIDVPPISEGEGKLWDLYFERIDISGGGELRVRMPTNGGGRLVRIFLNQAITFNAGAKLRVEYVNEDAVYTGGQWTNVTAESKVLSNEEYSGNLLIYMKDDVSWNAFHGDDLIQGSLVTQGTMEVGSNLHLAGQLIAENLKIIAEFDGSGFRYVPFDPAVLDPELFSVRDFDENGTSVEVPVRLDTNTVTDVYFNYCFELTDEEPENGKTSDQRADITDFDAIPHLCGVDTGSVTILAGSKYPTESTKIYITVKLDAYKEMYGTSLKEGFKLRVFDMVGAVLKDNTKEGYFSLNVVDKNVFPETRDTTFTVAEDDTVHFSVDMFPYESIIGSEITSIRIEELPDATAGKLVYNGKTVTKNQVIPVDSLDKLIFVPNADFYDDGTKSELTTLKFAVIDANGAISSEDKDALGNVVGNKEFVITVDPVNDAPTTSPATYTTAGHSIPEGTVLKGSITVTDVDDTAFTFAFDKDDENFALVDSLFEINPNTGAISVKEGITLKRHFNDSLYTIDVIVGDKSATTGNEDDILYTISHVTIDIDYGYNPPFVDIVDGANSEGEWTNPSVIKTHIPDMELSCTFNNGDDVNRCMDTVLVEGCHIYKVSYQDDDHDGIAYDSVQICLSTATPQVSVSIGDNNVTADNIYTVVEGVDADDPVTYVNTLKNDIHVVVKDTVTGVNKDYTIALELDTAGISKSDLKEMESVEKANLKLDILKSTTIVSLGDTTVHSYEEEYKDGKSVTVSYKTDKDGEIIKVAVVNDKGKVDSVEVYTVTYVTTVDGKEVSVSYTADATTGEILVEDSNGNLYTEDGAEKKKVDAVPYSVSYDYKDSKGNTVNVTYSVDKNGDMVLSETGDRGYRVSYSYVNEYGNSATQSVMVVLDRIGPKVEITSPAKGTVVRANFVAVTWEVNGVEQDTLTLQSLEKGANNIVRYYKDKAGNIAADTVLVFMKDAKDVDVKGERAVTSMDKDKVKEYYEEHPEEKSDTCKVSIKDPKEDAEGHLGPTLVMDIKLPVVNSVGGLATLDDLVGSDGLVALDGVDAANSEKVTLEEYVDKYCEDDFDYKDMKEANLYDITTKVKIWIYTNLGNFVDYFSFSQELNDPANTDEVGMLQMYFEQKPDEDGYVRAKNGRRYATGAYLYKVNVDMKSKLRCTLPPVNKTTGKKKGDVIRSNDDMLKPFGYIRPGD